MRKSSTPTQNYRQSGSRNPRSLDTFRQQMADFMRGEELKRLREGKSLSQEELAAQLHVTTKTVRSWEKGGSIRPANARTVGTYFKVDPAELVRHELDTPDPFAENGDTPSQLDRIEGMLLQIIHALGLQEQVPAADVEASLANLREALEQSEQTTAQPGNQGQAPPRKSA